MLAKRYLLAGLVVCAVLYLAGRAGRRITPMVRDVPVTLGGSFTRDGQYPGEPFADAEGVRAWGSWSGADQNEGTLALGPFPAPRLLRFGVSGYPNNPGNELYIERVGSPGRRNVETGSVGELWRVATVSLPKDWRDQPVRIVAIDHAKAHAGWLAITEPILGGRSDGNQALFESLAAWAINGLLLGVMYWAAAGWLGQRGGVLPEWIPLAAGAFVVLAGYAAFWAYLANPLLGKTFSCALLGLSTWFTLRSRAAEGLPEMPAVTKSLLAIGAFYLALLHLFPTSHDVYTLAANRYRENLPADNVVAHTAAERLFSGETAQATAATSGSVREPSPLATGWELLLAPVAKTLGLDRRTAGAMAAFWFQLLWIPAAYGGLRMLGVAPRRATAWLAVCALSGFLVQHSAYALPKLVAGAFACGAFGVAAALPGRRTTDAQQRNAPLLVAVFAALAWLADPIIAAALIALLPWLVWRAWCRPAGWRGWLIAAAIFVVLVGAALLRRPGEPHLGSPQNQTIGATPSLGSSALHTLLEGKFPTLVSPSRATASERRDDESSYLVRGLTWWPLLALLALLTMGKRIWASDGRALTALGAWLALATAVWCVSLTEPRNALLSQAPPALFLGSLLLCSALLDRMGRGWLVAVATLQAFTFLSTWAVANSTIRGPMTGLPFVLVAAAALGWLVVRGLVEPATVIESDVIRDGPAPDAVTPGIADRFLAWWRHPQLNVWVLLALAVLLFLRKPHALTTPQLWAEDGSIFLMQNDANGLRAWFIPYMGYLHLLPRLIACAASLLLDPLWWPLFYNGVSFVLCLVVLGRLFSPRLDLPGKPWLALAFFLGPNTGEVLFNVTNLQWLTAFVLLQQVLIARPTSYTQRFTDLVFVTLAALTGVFVVVFAPLFAWRWWRDRHRDNLVVLLVVGACAAVQAWFVVTTAPKFDYQSQPLHLFDALNVIARRLLVWPIAGDKFAMELPARAIGIAGGVVISAVVAWAALRPGPRRGLRMLIVAAFGLILFAGMYRTRPDTWSGDNLVFADRYFYIPRVLFAWLLIWEFHAASRAVAFVARLTCAAAVVVHLRDYQIPPPPDYHWAEHVDPIRHGVRADIPTLPEGWTLEYHGRPGGR